MKFILRPGNGRMHKKDAWKESWYAFVPYQTNFGALCGFADDIVAAGQGFGMHPHQNMEITTILISGAQAHRDNTGAEVILNINSLQTMSAGTGIMHSEFNASQTESFHSYQIWVYPKIKDVAPRHGKFNFSKKDKLNKVLLGISPDGRNGTTKINQDAFFSISSIEKDNAIEYKMNLEKNGVYIHCAVGSVEIEGKIIAAGDALGIYETNLININALENSELIFVEVPMELGIKLQ
jgi:redox-sensitive bicupin YhaK (pirin superfamily)